jgi:hypothetical protein
MERFQKIIPLFPNHFKKIGLGIILAGILTGITRKLFFNEARFFIENKHVIKIVAFDILLLGLLFYGFAKEKVEDERTFQLRLESLAFGFYFGAGQVILDPLISPLFGKAAIFQSGDKVLFMMLFFYIMTFLGKKRFS